MNKLIFSLLLTYSTSALAADWDTYHSVPADAGEGYQWQLHSQSDDFNYEAPAVGKSDAFFSRWREGFINGWIGPGPTEFYAANSQVTEGMLVLTASRKPGTTDRYHTGIIHSPTTLSYPVYLEARVKGMNMNLTNAFWLLSPDSTQEIDIAELYGSDDPNEVWFDERVHISHHVFIREPFQDYQPLDLESWHTDGNGTRWREAFHTFGVYWRDPWTLEYYIDGALVRTVQGVDIIDPNGFTGGQGLNKPMQITFDVEYQEWREEQNTLPPTDDQLLDENRNRFFVDWIRIYQPVDANGNSSHYSVSKELAHFSSTGKVGSAVSGDNSLGFSINGDNINFNTLGDYADYQVVLERDGFYRLDLLAASPATGVIGADITINDHFVGHIAMENTGGWETYRVFSTQEPIQLTAGTHTIRIQSAGADIWQWNGDQFSLVRINESTATPTPTPTSSPTATPTPTPTPSPTPTATPTPTPTPSPTPTPTPSPTPTPVAKTIVIEAEQFTATGGSYQGFKTYSVNGKGGINWNQRGDWADYSITVAAPGTYVLHAYTGTPIANTGLKMTVNGQVKAQIAITNNGNWDQFILNTSPSFQLSAGTHTVRILSNGTSANTWEWNADRFELVPQ